MNENVKTNNRNMFNQINVSLYYRKCIPINIKNNEEKKNEIKFDDYYFLDPSII